MENLTIDQIGEKLLENNQFLDRLQLKITTLQKRTSKSATATLDALIEDVRHLLHDLIRQQLENQLKEIIEDNNLILNEIKSTVAHSSKQQPLHEICQDVSFSEVHRIMDEERKKLRIPEEVNDAELERSISAFVELKVETIEERVMSIDKRLKGMEDKYQTNLKSIWNVISITESALFDHLNKDSKKCGLQKSVTEKDEQGEKKSFFGSIFKSSK